MRATLFFAVLLLALCVASAAVSAPIANEDFGVYVTVDDPPTGLQGRIVPNNKDGNPIGGQSPPDTATSGIYNWVAPANPWGAHRVYAGDLSYPDHFMGGEKRFREESGGLDVTATLDVQSVTGSPGGVFSSLENSSGAIGLDGSTLYVSFLYQLLDTGTSVTQNFLEFREGTTNRFRFGQVWQDDQITAQGFDLTPLDTNPHLAVLKIDYAAGDDAVSLYFDPVAGLPESSQAVTNTYSRPMEMDQIFFKGQGNSFDFDELRFGTGWEDVVPVESQPPPGPATYEDAVLADGPFAYYRLNEAGGTTATNLGTVGPPLDGTYNNASGFTFEQPSLLPSGEDLSIGADGGGGSGGTELRLPDNAELNTAAHDNKTVELWFEADSITSTRSVLYEQGGNTRGISIYVEDVAGEDTLFMGAWNLAESDWPVTFVSTPVSEDTPYYAVFVLDGDPDGDDNTNDGFVRGYLDGELIGTTAGAGNLRSHGNNTAAMGIWENVRFADGATQGDGANVAGFLDELALYNIKLDDPNNDGDLSDSRVLAHFNAAGGGAAVIPEPSAFALAALGLLGLGLVGWRRRRK